MWVKPKGLQSRSKIRVLALPRRDVGQAERLAKFLVAQKGVIMKETNRENFENDVLKNELPVLVDFFATWCGPCRMLSPVLESLIPDYEGKVAFYKLDVDQAPDIAAEYGVMSIPTLIIFDKGEAEAKTVGFSSADELADWIDENSGMEL